MAQKVRPRPKQPVRPRVFIKEWREFRNLTQEALAERVGVTQGQISHMETGRSDVTGDMLGLLADALRCERSDILNRNPLDKDAPWSIWETVKALPPEDQERVAKIVDALAPARKTASK